MSKSVHITGMGLLGSFLAHRLSSAGIPFTWDDNETKYNAWGACTGAVIPCEESDDSNRAIGYRYWNTFQDLDYASKYVERVQTIYVTKGAPARVKDKKRLKKIEYKGQVFWLEPATAYQFDVDTFVYETREKFKQLRTTPVDETDIPDVTVVRCRGVNETINRPIVVWGWRIFVLEINPCYSDCPILTDNGLRPVLHFNDPDRTYERYYFHPIARSPGYWAGSEAVLQKEPTPNLERAMRGVNRFIETVKVKFGGILSIEWKFNGEIEQGWRPKPRKAHSQLLGNQYFYRFNNSILPIPLYKSGVQLGPLVANSIAEEIERDL